MKVIIKVEDMAGEHSIYSVGFFAKTYGSGSPCNNEKEVQKAIEHCKEWIIKEGDTPVVEDIRRKNTLQNWI